MAGTKVVEVMLADALGANAQIADLREELQSWLDNMPENMQQGAKADELNDVISAMDNADNEFELTDALTHLSETKFPVTVYKKATSRPKRRDDAVAELRGAAEFLRTEAERLTKAKELLPETTDNAEDIAERGPLTQDEAQQVIDDAEALADEIETAIDEYDGIDFPGMM